MSTGADCGTAGAAAVGAGAAFAGAAAGDWAKVVVVEHRREITRASEKHDGRDCFFIVDVLNEGCDVWKMIEIIVICCDLWWVWEEGEEGFLLSVGENEWMVSRLKLRFSCRIWLCDMRGDRWYGVIDYEKG